MKFVFVSLYHFFSTRRKLVWILMLGLFVLAVAGAVRIRLENDINRMVPSDKGIDAMSEVLNKTKTAEQIIFNISFKDPEQQNQDSLITLYQRILPALERAGKGYISKITDQVNDDKEQRFSELALEYLPLFLSEDDYRKIDSMLVPGRIRATLEKEHRLLLSPAGIVARQWIAHDPIGMVPLAFEKLQALQFDPGYELYDGYLFNRNGNSMTVFLELEYSGSETGKNALLFARMDEFLQQCKERFPQVQMYYFGGPAVAAANAVQMRTDTILTLSITIVLLLALTLYVFRRKSAPIYLMLPVVFGATCGLAIMYWVQGTVSVIALGAGAIILGIAIDFSVHFLSHIREGGDMREHVRSLAEPLTLGALTTVGAFLALRFANAPVLRDLGLFAASSLAGASLFTLIFLPHLTQQWSMRGHTMHVTFIDRLAQLRPEGNKWLLVAVLLATPLLWHFAGKVQFDADLMHLNYMSPQLKAAQEDLNRHNDYALSSVFVVAKDSSKEQARQKLENIQASIQQLKADGHVRNYINPVQLLPSEKVQTERLARWKQFWTSEKVERTLREVAFSAQAAGFSREAFSGFQQTLTRSYAPLDPEVESFLQHLLPGSMNEKDGLYYAIASLKVNPGSRQQILTSFDASEEVVATDRQSVAERLLALLQEDFNTILFYSAILVFVALLIAYGRIELALISFLPMALTWVWILGLMGILGLKFNVVNIIIATLIFGLGDDYAIFMMDSLMERYRTGKSRITAARSAVYLSVLTTVIGLGTLIFARHPALHSVAVIAVLGLICVVFVSQVLQPFLFNFMIQSRANKGFMPFSLWSLIKSAFSFLYFFTGCVLVTISGIILVGLRPLGNRRSKYVFHFILSKYTGSVMYVMSNTRKRILRHESTSFEKPAVYIANHASFLDILLTTMLHPKLVLLTNKWVWRSPVFGKIVRMAEYYPVAEGAEDSIEPLRDLVQRGYSIVVFPEGTRSKSDRIHRFHKGAFYIAEKLNLDVVPLLLHGVHYTMQKGDWLLKDGTTTVKFYPPIRPGDTTWGTSYSERSRKIAAWFRKELALEKVQSETPSYFREQIIKSNIYKGPVLEWYCRVKTKLEQNYEPFHALLPRSGNFYDLGCGYGFMTYMLHWASEERRFIGVDYDEDKIETARHNYKRGYWPSGNKPWQKADENDYKDPGFSVPITFVQADLTTFTLHSCDGIIVSDVLHYLVPVEQLALLNRCYEALSPGGTLVLRDGVEELEVRHAGTKRTELLSTRVFNFNKTTNELHFISRAFIEDWARQHGMQLQILDLSRNTSNLIFVLKKKNAEDRAAYLNSRTD